ncbi:MAG: NADH-quinone oxidoreductase subunit C [Flammeovirgaceae bacterium]
MLTIENIAQYIKEQFGEKALKEINTKVIQPYLVVETSMLADICLFLRDDERIFMDMLSCITGIDNGADVRTMEVIYHLYSIPYNFRLTLKVILERVSLNDGMPEVPTLSFVWKSANWMERETYDMFGIQFVGHPDLRRILLPADWVGYPLRKDYKAQGEYHGIKVEY